MKSRVLLLSAIVAATAGLSVGTAQADQPDAQAQAAALLSSSYVASPAIASNASAQAVQGDAQAQAAALLSGARIGQSDASEQVATSRDERPSLDAQAHAATTLSGTRSTVQEIARTSATTQQLGDHPAVIAARTWSTRGLDPNTFVVAHPARLALVAASPSETEGAQRTDVQARLGR
jgi:hypothetical protein